MQKSVGVHDYAECGLTNVLLLGVNIYTCPCGKRAVSIPEIEGLHRVLARAVAEKTDKLVPQEIRFLRKWLGFSSVDFAGVMGKSPETVSRWENATSPMTMGPAEERLLRLMVMTRDPVKEYPLDRLSRLNKNAVPSPLKLSVRHSARHWAPEVATA